MHNKSVKMARDAGWDLGFASAPYRERWASKDGLYGT